MGTGTAMWEGPEVTSSLSAPACSVSASSCVLAASVHHICTTWIQFQNHLSVFPLSLLESKALDETVMKVSFFQIRILKTEKEHQDLVLYKGHFCFYLHKNDKHP